MSDKWITDDKFYPKCFSVQSVVSHEVELSPLLKLPMYPFQHFKFLASYE